jgi:hypothetical protein
MVSLVLVLSCASLSSQCFCASLFRRLLGFWHCHGGGSSVCASFLELFGSVHHRLFVFVRGVLRLHLFVVFVQKSNPVTHFLIVFLEKKRNIYTPCRLFWGETCRQGSFFFYENPIFFEMDVLSYIIVSVFIFCMFSCSVAILFGIYRMIYGNNEPDANVSTTTDYFVPRAVMCVQAERVTGNVVSTSILVEANRNNHTLPIFIRSNQVFVSSENSDEQMKLPCAQIV